MVVLWFIVLLILMILLEWILVKLLGIEKKRITETDGRRIDSWGRSIILAVFLIALPFVIYGYEVEVIKWYFIIYSVFILGFQSFLEWRYLKDSRQYIITLVYLILGVTFLYNIEYFTSLMGWEWK